MLEQLFLVCSIIVIHPEGNRYIPIQPCQVRTIGSYIQVLQENGLDPYSTIDVVLSPYTAEFEREQREGDE